MTGILPKVLQELMINFIQEFYSSTPTPAPRVEIYNNILHVASRCEGNSDVPIVMINKEGDESWPVVILPFKEGDKPTVIFPWLWLYNLALGEAAERQFIPMFSHDKVLDDELDFVANMDCVNDKKGLPSRAIESDAAFQFFQLVYLLHKQTPLSIEECGRLPHIDLDIDLTQYFDQIAQPVNVLQTDKNSSASHGQSGSVEGFLMQGGFLEILRKNTLEQSFDHGIHELYEACKQYQVNLEAIYDEACETGNIEAIAQFTEENEYLVVLMNLCHEVTVKKHRLENLSFNRRSKKLIYEKIRDVMLKIKNEKTQSESEEPIQTVFKEKVESLFQTFTEQTQTAGFNAAARIFFSILDSLSRQTDNKNERAYFSMLMIVLRQAQMSPNESIIHPNKEYELAYQRFVSIRSRQFMAMDLDTFLEKGGFLNVLKETSKEGSFEQAVFMMRERCREYETNLQKKRYEAYAENKEEAMKQLNEESVYLNVLIETCDTFPNVMSLPPREKAVHDKIFDKMLQIKQDLMNKQIEQAALPPVQVEQFDWKADPQTGKLPFFAGFLFEKQMDPLACYILSLSEYLENPSSVILPPTPELDTDEERDYFQDAMSYFFNALKTKLGFEFLAEPTLRLAPIDVNFPFVINIAKYWNGIVNPENNMCFIPFLFSLFNLSSENALLMLSEICQQDEWPAGLVRPETRSDYLKEKEYELEIMKFIFIRIPALSLPQYFFDILLLSEKWDFEKLMSALPQEARFEELRTVIETIQARDCIKRFVLFFDGYRKEIDDEKVGTEIKAWEDFFIDSGKRPDIYRFQFSKEAEESLNVPAESLSEAELETRKFLLLEKKSSLKRMVFLMKLAEFLSSMKLPPELEERYIEFYLDLIQTTQNQSFIEPFLWKITSAFEENVDDFTDVFSSELIKQKELYGVSIALGIASNALSQLKLRMRYQRLQKEKEMDFVDPVLKAAYLERYDCQDKYLGELFQICEEQQKKQSLEPPVIETLSDKEASFFVNKVVSEAVDKVLGLS